MNALDKIITKNETLSHAEIKKVLRFISIGFSYAWWAIIIVHYGMLAENLSAGHKISSLPIVVVSLALVQVLSITLKQGKILLSSLSVLGLIVSGLLA